MIGEGPASPRYSLPPPRRGFKFKCKWVLASARPPANPRYSLPPPRRASDYLLVHPLDGETGQLAGSLEVELLLDVGTMGLDGFGAEV
jgi:hypothetical protein